MTDEYAKDCCYGAICLAVLASIGFSFIFQIPMGTPLIIGFFIFFGVLWIVLGVRSSKKKSDRKAKELVEKTVKEQNFTDTQLNIAKEREVSLWMLEERVNEELNQIHFLITQKKLKEAQAKLFNCRRIAIKNRFQYLIPKIEQLKLQLQYLQENQR